MAADEGRELYLSQIEEVGFQQWATQGFHLYVPIKVRETLDHRSISGVF
jgi:uncharacterized protein YcgL (UPF0745 family)